MLYTFLANSTLLSYEEEKSILYPISECDMARQMTGSLAAGGETDQHAAVEGVTRVSRHSGRDFMSSKVDVQLYKCHEQGRHFKFTGWILATSVQHSRAIVAELPRSSTQILPRHSTSTARMTYLYTVFCDCQHCMEQLFELVNEQDNWNGRHAFRDSRSIRKSNSILLLFFGSIVASDPTFYFQVFETKSGRNVVASSR